MQVKVFVTTTVTDASGSVITQVTTVEKASVGDNPRLVRDAIRNADVYGKAISLNLDQVEARFSRG
jgi:hypothetical protein